MDLYWILILNLFMMISLPLHLKILTLDFGKYLRTLLKTWLLLFKNSVLTKEKLPYVNSTQLPKMFYYQDQMITQLKFGMFKNLMSSKLTNNKKLLLHLNGILTVLLLVHVGKTKMSESSIPDKLISLPVFMLMMELNHKNSLGWVALIIFLPSEAQMLKKDNLKFGIPEILPKKFKMLI